MSYRIIFYQTVSYNLKGISEIIGIFRHCDDYIPIRPHRHIIV